MKNISPRFSKFVKKMRDILTKKKIFKFIKISYLAPFLSMLLALAIGAIFILIAGVNPLDAYRSVLVGAFGNLSVFGETLAKTTPLILCGLAIVVSFRTKVFNIGAEGQLYMGALAATIVALALPGISSVLLIPLLFIVGFSAGAFWGFIPGVLKSKLRVNEVVTTMMLNFIATFFVSYMVSGPIKEPGATNNWTSQLPFSARLPTIISGTRIHLGVLIAILCSFLVYIILRKTVWGYQAEVVGSSRKAALYGGIDPSRKIISVMLLSGGLAGLAGMIEISGVIHRLIDGFSPGYGFMAIAVAMLAKLNPVGVTLSALLFGTLIVGGGAMQRATGIPIALVSVIMGLVVLLVLASEYYRSR